MKKRNSIIGFSMAGFLLFFITIATAVMVSVVLYDNINTISGGNILYISLSLLGMILFATIICVLIDMLRRKVMVDTPTQKILEATKKIASGDFNVRIQSIHKWDRYDEYDIIMENINIMAQELKKNEMLKTDFISNVSHEIKTPLSIIHNYVNMLQKDNLNNEDRNKYLDNLVVVIKRLGELITNILTLNKLENQQIKTEIEWFELGEFIRESIIKYENLIEDKGLEIECDIEDGKICSNVNYLEIVVNNLLSNAIKFTDVGKISVSVKFDKIYATISVSDTGCGISDDVGGRIFEKFYQVDTSHTSKGNGLGLALVKKVIDILGGEICVDSEVGKGSTFSVKIKRNVNG